jgi:hypothetical protein
VSVSDFSNVISKSDVKSLAEADEQEVVAEVQVTCWSYNTSLISALEDFNIKMRKLLSQKKGVIDQTKSICIATYI